MTRTFFSLASAVALAAAATVALAKQGPYAGWQEREIKALSAQQMEDLSAGRGMSLALAAELNGYPGPRHVLDLAEPLALTADQHQAVEELFLDMQRDAQSLGQAILEREAALDRAFREAAVTERSLRDELAALASLQGELRFVHLHHHLKTKALLSDHQVALYDRLRGYESGQDHQQPHRHGKH